MISTTLSSSSLIHPTVSSNLLLNPFKVLFISVIELFISIWFFFVFPNFLLKTSNFSLCSFNRLLSSLNIFTITTLNSSLGCLSPLPLVLLLGFYLVPSFGIYFCVVSFCLICSFYFYLFSMLVMFPSLGEVAFCKGCPMHHSSALPFGHQSYMFQVCPYMDCLGSFVVEG